MSFEVAIKVENLSKCYQIYDQPQDRLKQSVYPYFQKLIGHQPKKYYREFWALKDVSFEIKRGETFGIVGKNGAGKSTLLQIICGTLNPTFGSAQTFGRVAALLELGSGFNPEFSGRENIYINATLLGLTKQQIDQRFGKIAEFADIGEFIERPVKTYSSGMYVRLAFAVIAHVDADILVIDEALAVGDVFFTQKCMRFLREFTKKGTLIFVTHDTSSVMSFCTSAIWLEKGQTRLASSAKEVCEAYLEKLNDVKITAPTPVQLISPESHQKVTDFGDMRQIFVNQTNLRNDLEVFLFSEIANFFGTDQVGILDVFLGSENGSPMSWVVGGEIVELSIVANCKTAIDNPIIGFVVRDKLGQTLFGDNTFLTHQNFHPSSSVLTATFSFRMPVMPIGDYTISVAVAEGTQNIHTMHTWVHDALVFKSHASSAATGLLGIPMLKILLT